MCVEGARKTPLNQQARKNQVFSISLLKTRRYGHAWICLCAPVLQWRGWQRLPAPVSTNSCTLGSQQVHAQSLAQKFKTRTMEPLWGWGTRPNANPTSDKGKELEAQPQLPGVWPFGPGITATDTARWSTLARAAINYRAWSTREQVEEKKNNNLPFSPENVFLSFSHIFSRGLRCPCHQVYIYIQICTHTKKLPMHLTPRWLCNRLLGNSAHKSGFRTSSKPP